MARDESPTVCLLQPTEGTEESQREEPNITAALLSVGLCVAQSRTSKVREE